MMLLTDNDRNRLLAVVGNRGVGRQVTLVCMILFVILFAAFKFYAGVSWAEMGGYSLHRFLVLWSNGVSADATYSGCLIKAGDDMSAGVLYLGMALILGVVWWQGRQARERTQRIINSLKSAGAW